MSLALLGAGVSIAIESISEIRTPHRLPAPYTLVVLLAVVLIKSFCRTTSALERTWRARP